MWLMRKAGRRRNSDANRIIGTSREYSLPQIYQQQGEVVGGEEWSEGMLGREEGGGRG